MFDLEAFKRWDRQVDHGNDAIIEGAIADIERLRSMVEFTEEQKMMNKRDEAYQLGRRAAELDFSMALQGLMAGHAAAMETLRDLLSKKDAALLASLAISKKGSRIGADDGLAKTVRDGIGEGINLSPIERDFIART
jgi:hypothetical protein